MAIEVSYYLSLHCLQIYETELKIRYLHKVNLLTVLIILAFFSEEYSLIGYYLHLGS